MSEFITHPAVPAGRRLRPPRGLVAGLATVVAVAATLVASNLAQGTARAAGELPDVTWTRTVADTRGHNDCRYDATLAVDTGTQTDGAVRAAQELGVWYELSGGSLVIHSDWFFCEADSPSASATSAIGRSAARAEPVGWSRPAAGHLTVQQVDFADVLLEAKGASLGVWIVGAVVGAAVAAAIAIYGGPAIVAAAAAAGVTITVETATIAATCLAGATGGAIGEYIKGNNSPRIATSAVVGCAGGTFVGVFRSLTQARSVVGQAAAELAAEGGSATTSAVRMVTGATRNIPALSSESGSFFSGAVSPLSNSVRSGLQRSASF